MRVKTDGFIKASYENGELRLKLDPDFLSRLGYETNGPFASAYPTINNTALPAETLYVFKTAIETRTASTTLTADTDIQFEMEADKTYLINLTIYFDTVAAADFKYDFDGPAAAGTTRIQHSHIIPGGTTFVDDLDTAYNLSTSVVGGGTTGGVVRAEILIANGNTAGTFSFRWAQDTSDAGNTSVLPGSWMEIKIIE